MPDVIRDALKDALGVNWQVRCEARRCGQFLYGRSPPAPVPESTDARAGERRGGRRRDRRGGP